MVSPYIKLGENAADRPWEVKKRVRKLVGFGVDFIKVFASAWFGEFEEYWWPNYSFEEMGAICEEAHRFKKRVAVHATTSSSIYDAIKAGCDTIEHLVEIGDKTIELILEKKIVVIPTVGLFSERFIKEKNKQQKTTVVEQIKLAKEKVIENFQKCLKAGVKFATGSDIYRILEQGSSANEISQMVEFGMSEKEAIISSTKNAAEALGLEGDVGTLIEGKYADIIVIEGNPLKDINILLNKENIKYVIKEGKIEINRT